MKLKTLSTADQIQRESELRRMRSDEMPSAVKYAKSDFNEDALMVHPDTLFSNPRNSRKTFNEAEIDDLAQSMLQQGVGVLQPILVRPRKFGPESLEQFEVMAGDRRLLAARKAGLTRVPIIVRRADDRTARRINLIENLQRVDLPPTEMGAALLELKEDMTAELGEMMDKARAVASGPNPEKRLGEAWNAIKSDLVGTPFWMQGVIDRAIENGRAPKVTWDDVALEAGFADVRSLHYYVAISRLPEDIAEEVNAGELSQQQARALTTLTEPRQQRQLVKEIREKKLSGPAAMHRAGEIKSRSSSGISRPATGRAILTNLSESSSPMEGIGAAREAAQILANVRQKIEARVEKFGPYDAQNRMLLRAELQKWREQLDALSAIATPVGQAQRAPDEENDDKASHSLVG